MKKIISLFQRNYEGDHLVRDELVEGAEWVVAGEGVATRKFDRTCCLVRNSKLYRRYDAKHGKAPPVGWEAAQEPDPVTGHWPGWIQVGNWPGDKWYIKAWLIQSKDLSDGTYELCGPHFQTNPEGFTEDVFIPHGGVQYPNCPRDYEGLKTFLAENNIEGVVWHHPDGRMVKIKTKDFGLKRGSNNG